jgi:hypothetical protein
VHPLHGAVQPSQAVVRDVVGRAQVPVWLPWPLPSAWLVTGVAHAGDDRTGARAVAVACSGPAPLGGVGELVLVAEEPGVGLGAHLAGLDGPDPGADVADRTPDAKVDASGHPTPLWALPGRGDCAIFVGEARAAWLWALLWPAHAGHLVAEELMLTDLRDPGFDLDLPFGARSPRLPGAGAARE